MNIERHIVLPGRRNNQAWFAPSVAIMPQGSGSRVFVRVVQLTGNDIGPEHFLWTDDLGRTWTPPWESQNLPKIPMADDVFEWPAFGLYYHRKTQSLLGIGTTLFSRDRGDEANLKSEMLVFDPKYRFGMAWTRWDPRTGDFAGWEKLDWKEYVLTPGCGQWHECEDGMFLMPCINQENPASRRVGTFKMRFDGTRLAIIGAGRTVGMDLPGGADEPSIIQYGDGFLMTIRSECMDDRMYLAKSADGLNWEGIEPWRWDDGSIVETKNTQQHWLRHGSDLFLVYTRKGELNNGIFRCRAPLYIARVDSGRLRLIRETEQIVFPEDRARMGNFCTVNINENEAWILTGEWREGFVPGHTKGSRFWMDCRQGECVYNWMQYIGNLLLARITFG